jgi:hypothetical protein
VASTVIRRPNRLLSALFVLVPWSVTPAASAQTPSTLPVPGLVVDEVGGAHVGARVTASDASGVTVQTTTADTAGAFSLQGLAPSTYSVAW